MWIRWRHIIPIAVVLALAAALRFWGLRWGLPNELHSYSYHPDEFLTIGAAGAVLTGGFPRFYNYPSLYIYLASIAILLGSAYGLAPNVADVYLCARVVTALTGTAAVAVTYWAGKRLYDRQGNVVPDATSAEHVVPHLSLAGLLAALILAIAPLHVQHSHFATVDVPSTVFIAACLGFAGLVLKRGSWRDYILCGAMAGFAAGTKYNAGVLVLSLIAAHFLRRPEHLEPVEGSRAVKLVGGLGGAMLAFVVSTPAVLFRWRDLSYGFAYELRHAAEGHGLTFVGTGNGFLFTFTSSLWYGLGPALAILLVIASIYGLIRLDRRAFVILAFAVPYYALISLSQVRFARYALPLFPPAALLIAWMAVDLWSRFPKTFKWAWAALLTAALAGTLLYTLALDRLFVQPLPQDRAARWIFANIPKGSTIGTIDTPWFYSPPYSKTIGGGILQQRIIACQRTPYPLRGRTPLPGNGESRWWVLTDYEIADAERLRSKGLPPDGYRTWGDHILHKLDYVRHYYAVQREFCSRLSAFGISFGSTRSLPHDMRYPAPTIWIYEVRM